MKHIAPILLVAPCGLPFETGSWSIKWGSLSICFVVE